MTYEISGLIFWEIATISNYSRVKIYRSPERLIGDFANVGEKIFDGYGSTDALVFPANVLSEDEETTQPSTSKYLFSSPPEAATTPQKPERPAVVIRPDPPRNLRASIVLTGLAHFADTPPQPDTPYTYTIYALNSAGREGYPVVVNARLRSSATNLTVKSYSSLPGRISDANGLKWTPMFEPLGAFFKLVFFEAAPVSVGSSFLRASIILERENDVV